MFLCSHLRYSTLFPHSFHFILLFSFTFFLLFHVNFVFSLFLTYRISGKGGKAWLALRNGGTDSNPVAGAPS